MKRLPYNVLILFRVTLALLLAIQTIGGIVTAGVLFAEGPLNQPLAAPAWQQALYHAVLTVVSIWLFFGIRTRVVALVGAVLFIAFAIMGTPYSVGSGSLGFDILLVSALALPLIVSGGGRACAYRAGWKRVA